MLDRLIHESVVVSLVLGDPSSDSMRSLSVEEQVQRMSDIPVHMMFIRNILVLRVHLIVWCLIMRHLVILCRMSCPKVPRPSDDEQRLTIYPFLHLPPSLRIRSARETPGDVIAVIGRCACYSKSADLFPSSQLGGRNVGLMFFLPAFLPWKCRRYSNYSSGTVDGGSYGGIHQIRISLLPCSSSCGGIAVFRRRQPPAIDLEREPVQQERPDFRIF
jgi:hypothetical protein